MLLGSVFFFFKQKTAYEIGVRLVGSEMCIRDRDAVALDAFVGKVSLRYDSDTQKVKSLTK